MKKYFFKNIISILLLLIIVIFINYSLDSYGVFGHSLQKQVLEPNKNYIKTRYILNNPKEYDSFIFGSSKIGVFSVNEIKNGKYFNMTYSQGLPSEWLNTLEIFIKNKIQIKKVIIAIDSFSFTVDPSQHYNQPMRIPYDKLRKKELFTSYLLVNPFNSYNIITLKNRYLTKNYYDFFTFEKNRERKIDYEIDKNIEKHKKDPKFNVPIAFNEMNRLEQTIKEFQDIKKICDKEKIQVYFLINPVHKVTMEASNKKGFEELKTELSKITDYWDFSKEHEVLNDNYYWYETSHFRFNLADLILKTIFKEEYNEKIELENFLGNFGEYISKVEQ